MKLASDFLPVDNPVYLASYSRINGAAYRPEFGPFHALTVPGLRINGAALYYLYVPILEKTCSCVARPVDGKAAHESGSLIGKVFFTRENQRYERRKREGHRHGCKTVTKILGIVQVKGGAGRSTVATNLAGELSKIGTVALIDCDQPQGTSASWASLRQGLGEKSAVGAYTAATHRDLVAVASKVMGKVDYLILDGPPRIAEMSRAILALSTIALVPVGASLAEVWATADVVPLVQEAQGIRPVDVRLIWTRFRAHTRLAQELEAHAGQELGLKSLKAHLGFRVAYAEALGEGLTAAETGDPAARDEIAALVAEVRRLTR